MKNLDRNLVLQSFIVTMFIYMFYAYASARNEAINALHDDCRVSSGFAEDNSLMNFEAYAQCMGGAQ